MKKVLVFLTLLSAPIFANPERVLELNRDDLKSMLDGDSLPSPEKGYQLFEVEAGSRFEKLGLKPGDKIVSINGYDLNSVSAVQRSYAQIDSAESIEVVYFRNAKQHRKVISR